MPRFQVDVSWTIGGGQIIEAANETEAREIADTMRLEAFFGDYIQGSFVVDCVEETEIE
jgi:hypothetical protein